MRVIVTRDCGVYHSYNVEQLTKDQVIEGTFAEYLLSTGAPVVEQTDTTGDVDGDGVPDGTAKEVLDWVGEDAAKAALALQAENGRDKPRSTLVAQLEKLAVPVEQPPADEPPADEPPAENGSEGGTDANGQG